MWLERSHQRVTTCVMPHLCPPVLSSNNNPDTPRPFTYPFTSHPKIDMLKPAASSRRQLFSASSVNVGSKVHAEIMEHVTFFPSLSVSRRSEEPERFGWEGSQRRGGRGEAPEGAGEMSQSVLERVSDIDLLP